MDGKKQPVCHSKCGYRELTVRLVRCTTLVGTLLEINFLVAFLADMFPVELIGKNFFFCTTLRTFTEKRFKVSKGFKPRAVTTRCIHSLPLQLLN